MDRSMISCNTQKTSSPHEKRAMKSQPNSYAGHFRDASDDWNVDRDDEPARVAAAWLQCRVWAAIAEGRASVESFATDLKQSPEAQRKKLSGAQPASLRDLAAWMLAAGAPAYESLPREDSEFFPASAWQMLAGWRSGSGRQPAFVSGTDPDWGSVAESAVGDLASMEGRSALHLLTSDWLRQRVLLQLDATGIAPQKMRLASQGDVPGLRIGVVDPVLVLFELVGLRQSHSFEESQTVALRLRDCVAALAEANNAGFIVVATVGKPAAEVVNEAVPINTGRTEATIGPFEATGAPDWWSRNQVVLSVVADVEMSSSAAKVLKIGKASEF